MSAPVDPPAPPPVVETPPAAPETTPEPANLGPWAGDLAEYFGENAEAIAAADRYMREKVQPARTQFETETAPARELYKDLIENPETTLAEVVEELWGTEKAQQFATLFGEPEPASTPAVPDEVPEWAKPLVEREQAARDAELAAQGQAEYERVLAELQAAHTDLTDADMELIHPFMASASGDPEAAYAGYQAFKAAFVAEHGATPAVEPTPTPPPVLGAEGTAPSTPPVQKEYKTFDEAWDAWRAEEAAAPPPVVGSA